MLSLLISLCVIICRLVVPQRKVQVQISKHKWYLHFGLSWGLFWGVNRCACCISAEKILPHTTHAYTQGGFLHQCFFFLQYFKPALSCPLLRETSFHPSTQMACSCPTKASSYSAAPHFPGPASALRTLFLTHHVRQ